MPEIILRFVASDTEVSRLIRAQCGIAMPFPPSHVEALSRDGKGYVGAHIDGGVLKRPLDYDKDEPGLEQKFVRIPVSPEGYNAFHDYMEAQIGSPYDWKAIIGFAPDLNLHTPGAKICSALVTLGLRAKNCVFPWPTTVPAHHVSPYMLFFALSTHVEIDHEADPCLPTH